MVGITVNCSPIPLGVALRDVTKARTKIDGAHAGKSVRSLNLGVVHGGIECVNALADTVIIGHPGKVRSSGQANGDTDTHERGIANDGSGYASPMQHRERSAIAVSPGSVGHVCGADGSCAYVTRGIAKKYGARL
jgi:hypothetical protein